MYALALDNYYEKDSWYYFDSIEDMMEKITAPGAYPNVDCLLDAIYGYSWKFVQFPDTTELVKEYGLNVD